jgi:hypothetical protein
MSKATYAVIAVLAAALAVTSVPGLAHAEDDWSINGVFRVQSNGDWAQSNDRFQNEPVVVSTWTISTTCTGPSSCTGQVTSDQGWKAPIYRNSAQWFVKRSLPGWEPCPDGTAADGQQLYRFYPVAADGTTDVHSTTYAGFDHTIGPSGACGSNKPLEINVPLKLTPLP